MTGLSDASIAVLDATSFDGVALMVIGFVIVGMALSYRLPVRPVVREASAALGEASRRFGITFRREWAIPLLIVAFNTILQKQTPGHLMGRVSTTTEVLTTTPQALSIALGALLVTVLDFRVIFVLMTAGTLLGAVYLVVALRGRMALPVPGDADPVDVPVIPGSVLPETVVEPAP